ncbi:MAG: hypothetical protein JJT77_12350 [Crocinitomicaceae bacterium]|nr:hypothetical protein [Crocinitomicaceae bacterium]
MAFFTELPISLLLIWTPIAAFLAYWLYLPKLGWIKEIKPIVRWSLVSLRFLGLWLLGLLILGLLFERKSYNKEKPLIISLLDSSSSMLNYVDSAEVPVQINAFLEGVQQAINKDFEHLILDFDGVVKVEEGLNFNFNQSNLSNLLQNIYDTYYGKNIGAINFISDGNFNVGNHPLYVAQQLRLIPIHTLGVGYTIRKKDILIRSISHNDVSFLGNIFPLQVNIESIKLPASNVKVELFQRDVKLDEKTVSIKGQEFQTLQTTFFVEAKEIGIIPYEVRISPHEGEFNYTNNNKTVYIEVIDARSKILLIGVPNPDLGAIRQVLIKDKNLEVEGRTPSNFPEKLSIYDLIILHNPAIGFTTEQLAQIKSVNKPIWYVLGPTIRQENISQLGLPIQMQLRGQKDEVGAAWNQLFTPFTLSPSTKDQLERLPPLTVPYGNLKVSEGMEILAFQKVGNIAKNEPLIFFGELNNEKFGVSMGEGFWRWRLALFQRYGKHDAFEELIQKMVQYLAVRSNTSKFRVQIPKSITEDDHVIIKAFCYNDIFEPITDAKVSLILKNEKGEEFPYDFGVRDNFFQLNMGKLSAGIYDWQATAEMEKETIQKSGAFTVQKIELEDLETRANHTLLKQIAAQSEGLFFPLVDYQQLISELENSSAIQAVTYESITMRKLVDYKWVFFLIIALFTIEWFLRRYNGSY